MKYTKDNPLRVIEICSGYGSQSIALERLHNKYPDFHYKVVGISEIDKYALEAYYAIHDKDIPNLGDLTQIDWESAPKCDLLTYSTPVPPSHRLVNKKDLQRIVEQNRLSYGLVEKLLEYYDLNIYYKKMCPLS